MEIGLLLLRLLLAAMLFMHATQKLFGWFNGPGLTTAAAIFDGLGQRPGRTMAVLAVVSELAGAVLLLLGLATPLGAAIATGTMLVAGAAMTLLKGTVWNSAGGGEYPLVLAGVAAVLGFTGPGAWSLDAALGVSWAVPHGTTAALFGLGAIVLAVLAALPPILRSRHALAYPSSAHDQDTVSST